MVDSFCLFFQRGKKEGGYLYHTILLIVSYLSLAVHSCVHRWSNVSYICRMKFNLYPL